MRKNTHQSDNPQVQRLNEIIEMKRISKADIARICGVSSQSVNNWFVRGAIGKSSAIKLADALGVSLEWVLGQDVDAMMVYARTRSGCWNSITNSPTKKSNRTCCGSYLCGSKSSMSCMPSTWGGGLRVMASDS